MTVTFSLAKNGEQLRRLQSLPKEIQKGVDDAIKKSIFLVEREAVKNAPRDNSDLVKFRETNFMSLEGELKFTAEHAIYVHEGTGIYGDKKRPIKAKGGGVLAAPVSRFKGKRGRQRLAAYKKAGLVSNGFVIFGKQIKGQKPEPFLKEAWEDNLAAVENLLETAIFIALERP